MGPRVTKLHDRLLIADDGDVLTLGTSLNGVGKTTTVMSPVPPPARDSLKDEYERLWASATLVGPEPPKDVDEDGEGRQTVHRAATTTAPRTVKLIDATPSSAGPTGHAVRPDDA